MTFNIDDGFPEAIVRGYRSGILTPADYANLTQCESLEGTTALRGPSSRPLPCSFFQNTQT
jgi:hypothetical protein